MISFLIYEIIGYLLFIGVATCFVGTGPLKKPTGPLKKPTGPLKKPTGPLPPPSGSGGTPPPPPPPPTTGGHQPMGLLPGQVNTSGGVSNLLFGTNIANYALQSFTPAEQAKLKQIGVTVLRVPLTDVSGNTFTDAQLTGLVNGCRASGALMLGILTRKNLAYDQHCVQFLGSNCNLYEFSNEPDLAPGVTPAQYTALWNQAIPTLRKINPKAAFIGPVLGVVANFNSWMVPFLKGAQAAGNLPDAVSFHDYPCTGDPTQAVCSTKTGNIGNVALKLNALIKATVGIDIPIAVTEWNVDASANLIAYAKDPAFVTPWAIAALEGMAAAGVVLATQFETNGSACCGWLGAAPLQTEIQKYKAGAVPPSGSSLPGGGPVASISNAVSGAIASVFGGQGFIPVAGTAITLSPNADVTQLLIALDEYMLINNPFTENMTAIPEDTVNLGVTSFTFTDPFSWLEQFGTNMFYDTAAIALRSVFLVIGTLLLIKVIGEFIDYGALAQAGASAIKFAALV